MPSANAPSPRKSLLVVGPKRNGITSKDLADLRSTITSTPDLAFLTQNVAELESLWPTIAAALPELENVQGQETLDSLHQFFKSGDISSLAKTKGRYNSIVLDIVTVLAHIVDFWRLATTKIETGIFAASITRPDSCLFDIQGFCLGFLTAAAVASSKDKANLEASIAKILRIAVCIGALVESDATKLERAGESATILSVSWGSQAEYEDFNNILKAHPTVSRCTTPARSLHSQNQAYVACLTDITRATVVVAGRDLSTVTEQLSASGLSAQAIHIEGRYHYRSSYEDSVQQLKKLFKRDTRFQLPGASSLVLPLRSNTDGKLILEGSLHEIALEGILLEQCQWYETVLQAVEHSGVQADDIVRVGADATVPRSLTKSSLRNGINGISQSNHAEFSDASAVAVIGMACRYPDADSIEEFWQLLSNGKSAVRPLPEGRFKVSEINREPKGAFWGNFLRNPDHYDHRFFGTSGREAKYMDPQQRLALQVAYEALESAGYFGIKSSAGNFPEDIGCYLGVGAVDYGDNIASHDATAFSALGTLRAFISGRISHYFGWSGPSITYDTACSSGAVAIHAAATVSPKIGSNTLLRLM